MPIKSFVAFDKLTAAEMNTLLGLKRTTNHLINGGMDIFQRGTSVATTGGYTLDRWYATSTSGNATVTQVTTAAALPANARYAARLLANATTTLKFEQVIETANTIPLAGKTVMASAWVTASAAAMGDVTVTLYYSTSDDVAPAGSWTSIDVGSLTSTTSAQLLSKTFDIPSTARTLKLSFSHVTTITSGQSFYIANAMLNEGTFVPPFQRAGSNIADELQLCKRYYHRLVSDPAATSPLAVSMFATYNASTIYSVYKLPNTMRIAPTVNASAGTIFRCYANATFLVSSAVAGGNSTTDSAEMVITVTGATTGQGGWLRFVPTANLYIEFSAEL